MMLPIIAITLSVIAMAINISVMVNLQRMKKRRYK